MKNPLLLLLLLLILVMVSALAAGIGAYHVPILDIPGIVLSNFNLPSAEKSGDYMVLMQVRFPRLALGLIVGACLAISGAALQGIFRNPLADPGLIGVSAGAGLGASLYIVLASRFLSAGSWGLSLAAFVGGSIVTFFVWRLAAVQKQVSTVLLLLGGIALNSLAGAGIGLLTYLSTDAQLRTLTFWLMGNLSGATWPNVITTLSVGLLGMAFLLPLGRSLNLLSLGEHDAWTLGVNTNKVNCLTIIGCTLAVGAAVSAAGGIGFVGLVVPHIVRIVRGPDHRFLLPASALLGSIMLISGDLVARTVAAPSEIPVGIITSLIGAPFFLGLIWRQRKGLVTNA